MAPSKNLSPSEKAFRKREAARLRQQRCRKRKRLAILKQRTEEVMKKQAAGWKIVNADSSHTIPNIKAPYEDKNSQIVEPGFPPLMQGLQSTKREDDSISSRSSNSDESSNSVSVIFTNEDFKAPLRYCSALESPLLGFKSASSSFSVTRDLYRPNSESVMFTNEDFKAPRNCNALERPPLGFKGTLSFSMTGYLYRPNHSLHFMHERCPSPLQPLLSVGNIEDGPSQQLNTKFQKECSDSELDAICAMLTLKFDGLNELNENNCHYPSPRQHAPPLLHAQHVSKYSYKQGLKGAYYKRALQEASL